MKFLKNLFAVPEGEKVTERHFKRVLISSVCGILLCMSCLMGTTWAWFEASVEKAFGPIEVAQHKAVLYDGNQNVEDRTLVVNSTTPKDVTVVFNTDADPTKDSFGKTNSFGYTPGRYIIMAVYTAAPATGEEAGQTVETTTDYPQYRGTYYMPAVYNTLDTDNDGTGDTNAWYIKLQLQTGENCKVVFSTAWNKPLEGVLAEPKDGILMLIQPSQPADETEVTSEPTGTTAATEATEAAKATEATEPPAATQAPAETTPATTEGKTE